MKFREVKETQERLESLISEEEKEERRKRNASITRRMNDLLFGDDLELESPAKKEEGASL